VLPGEEEQLRGTPVWEQVGEIWRLAHNVVVIGYSFGLPDSHYAEVWRAAFVDAMRENPAPIHIVSPQAADLAGDLSERIGRETNVFAWPFRWHALSRALIHALRAKGDRRLERLSARRVLWLHEYFCEN